MSENKITEMETNIEVEKNETAEEKVNKNLLFGTITYSDDVAYENFLQKMNLNQAIFILVASANFAQAKGAFNILESEVLSTAIRTIRKNSTPAETNQTPENNGSSN